MTNPTPVQGNTSPRRSFVTKLSIALSSLMSLMITLPGIGFVLAPIFRKTPRVWRTVGTLQDFAIGSTQLVSFEDPSPVPWAGVTAKTGAWLRRTGANDFVAFSINCRHLGCPVRWIQDARLFMCPCHGGVYYEDGSVAGGPPPKPLEKLSVRVRDGHVEIQTGAVPLTTNPV